jgi:hypothetical protein
LDRDWKGWGSILKGCKDKKQLVVEVLVDGGETSAKWGTFEGVGEGPNEGRGHTKEGVQGADEWNDSPLPRLKVHLPEHKANFVTKDGIPRFGWRH